MASCAADHPGGSGVEALGSGWALPWFELSVLEEHVARARERWKPSGCGWRRKRPRPSARPRRRSASRDGQAVLTAAGAQRVVLDTRRRRDAGRGSPRATRLNPPGVASVAGEQV